MTDKKTIIQILLISIIGTFLFDLVWTHIISYQNMPDFLTYFIAIKFIPSFLIIYFVHNYFEKRYNRKLAWWIGVPVAIFIFVAFVQLYYGVYPVPMADGTAVKLTIEQSFAGGYPFHVFDFLMSFFIISIIFRRWR